MVEWYRTAVANRQDPEAAIAFAVHFRSAGPNEQTEVRQSWNGELDWALPNPWRLACADESPGSVLDRIWTDLLFQALGYESVAAVDTRDAILGFSIVHNSCRVAGLDPGPVFEEVARAVGGAAARALRGFANRDPADQSMKAFGLSVVEAPGGGCEIKPPW